MPPNAARDSDFSDFGLVQGPSPRRGWRLRDLAFLMAVVAIALAVFLPARQTDCRVSRESQCSNSLRQVGLALAQYANQYGEYPPAVTRDASGRPLHSWRTLILPYLDEVDLASTINLAKPWDDPVNARALATEVRLLRCPSARTARNTTTFLAVVGSRCGFDPQRPRRRSDITDDPAATLLIVEADDAHAVPWMKPDDADEALVLALGRAATSPHPGGRNASFADHHAALLPTTTTPDALRSLMTINDGP